MLTQYRKSRLISSVVAISVNDGIHKGNYDKYRKLLSRFALVDSLASAPPIEETMVTMSSIHPSHVIYGRTTLNFMI